jgi:hypothetical protein
LRTDERVEAALPNSTKPSGADWVVLFADGLPSLSGSATPIATGGACD